MQFPLEIAFSSGETLYAVLHNPDGQVWNNTLKAWEVFNAANWSLYAVPLTEQGASGYYRGVYPVEITDVLTSEAVYRQAGGVPALGDAPSLGLGQSQGSSVGAVNGNAQAAKNMEGSLANMMLGAVVAGTLLNNEFTTDLPDTTDDVYQGRIVLFTSGALIRQVGNIIHFTASSATLKVAGPFTEAPGVGDTFVII